MSDKINDLEKLALAGTTGGCQNVIGNDTASGGYRLIVPDPDECGTLVRAIAPGDGMSISVDNTTNIMTLNSSSANIYAQQAFNTIGGGGVVSFNATTNRLTWDGVIRVAPVDSSINSSGSFNITMPPGGTQIPMYVGNSSTTSAVDNNGILFNASAALFYIPDGNVATNLNNRTAMFLKDRMLKTAI